MQKLYVVARVISDGTVTFPMAGGRGASVDSARAFTSLAAAKRSMAYLERYGAAVGKYTILTANTFTELQEETA